MKWLFMKQGYFVWPSLCVAIIGFMHYKGLIFNTLIRAETILDQSGSLLGFLLAFAGIIVALPPETYFIKFIFRYSHHYNVIKRCLVTGMVSFLSVMLSSLTGIYEMNVILSYCTVYVFIVGLAAMADIIFYLMQLFVQKFRDIRK